MKKQLISHTAILKPMSIVTDNQSGLVDYKTLSNTCAADLLAEVMTATTYAQRLSRDKSTDASFTGWMYVYVFFLRLCICVLCMCSMCYISMYMYPISKDMHSMSMYFMNVILRVSSSCIIIMRYIFNAIHFILHKSVTTPKSLLMQFFIFEGWFQDYLQQNFCLFSFCEQ